MDATALIMYIVLAGIIGWTLVSASIHLVKGECKIRRQHGGGIDLVKRSEEPTRFWLWVGVKIFIGLSMVGVLIHQLAF